MRKYWIRKIALGVKRDYEALRQDALNRLKYGSAAPLCWECVCIDPAQIKNAVDIDGDGFVPKGRHSGLVIGGDWDQRITTLDALFKYKACVKRYAHNHSWEETGIFGYLLNDIKKKNKKVDACWSLEDVKERYRRLDEYYEKIKREHRLEFREKFRDRSMSRLPPFIRREKDGILVHFDRNGNPVFGTNGHHRIAIAKVLGLSWVPIQVGAVHREALHKWREHDISVKHKK